MSEELFSGNKDTEPVLARPSAPVFVSAKSSPPVVQPVEQKTVEQWRDIKKTSSSHFAAAKTQHRWPQGRMMTEEQYDAGVKRARQHRIK